MTLKTLNTIENQITVTYDNTDECDKYNVERKLDHPKE